MKEDEIYSQCMMCRRVYKGDITKYNQDSVVSHGVCEQIDCKSAYLIFALGCTKEDALSILEEMIKE